MLHTNTLNYLLDALQAAQAAQAAQAKAMRKAMVQAALADDALTEAFDNLAKLMAPAP